MLLTLVLLITLYSDTDLLHDCNSLPIRTGVDSLSCAGHNLLYMNLSQVPTLDLEMELEKRTDRVLTSRPKGSEYRNYSVEEMSAMLPKDCNWTFVKHAGYDYGKDGQRNLLVVARCKCGKEETIRWDRLRANRLVSCGCIFRRGDKEIVMKELGGEMWHPVEGYEGIYEVSNLGRVKSLDRYVTRLGKSYLKKGRYMTDVSDRYKEQNRYINIGLRGKDGVKVIQTCIHRLVAIAFVANPENKPVVNHKNGLKWDSRADNLEWVTESENQQHALRTGLKDPKKGEDCHYAILKEYQVVEIRAKRIAGATGPELAVEYGVSPNCIYTLVNKRSWKHIQ